MTINNFQKEYSLVSTRHISIRPVLTFPNFLMSDSEICVPSTRPRIHILRPPSHVPTLHAHHMFPRPYHMPRTPVPADVKNCSDFTLLLDESTDESNRSELSLFARIVKNGKAVNHFLDLLHLSRCDAQSIFTKVFEFLQDEEHDIKKTRFAVRRT